MSDIELIPFSNAEAAVKRAREIYQESCKEITEKVLEIVKEVCEEAHKEKTDHEIYTLMNARLKDAAEYLVSRTYPLIVVRPYTYANLEEYDYFYLQRTSNFYGSTFSHLNIPAISARLTQNLKRIQRGIAPGFFPLRSDQQPLGRPALPIYVGKSSAAIPLSFAIGDRHLTEHIANVIKEVKADQFRKKKIADTIRRVMRDITSATNLVHISDRVVDATDRETPLDGTRYRLLPSLFEDALIRHSRETPRLAIPEPDPDIGAKAGADSVHATNYIKSDRERMTAGKLSENDLRPLAFYDALRTDYGYARLEHYGHTEFQYYQNYILLTNYKRYVTSFLMRIIETYIKEGRGRLYLPSFEIDESVKRGLSSDLKDWLAKGSKETLYLDKAWVASHVTFPKEGEHEQEASAAANSAGEGAQNQLSIKQWIGLWVNNFSSQMPAYHYVPDLSAAEAEEKHSVRGFDLEDDSPSTKDEENYLPGVSLINIGVGPSNAKNITDNLAVLRPAAWLMIGHCGGLRTTQKIGDFVLAQGYVRDDGVLNEELPPYVPIPELTEVTEAFREAAAKVLYESYKKDFPRLSRSRWFKSLLSSGYRDDTGQHKLLLERDWRRIFLPQRLRVGTVITTNDRNWELDPLDDVLQRFDKARGIAIDMESATIAANGFRHRVSYGTLLCVSDRPLFGDIKMRGMATSFYDEATSSHLDIGLEAVKRLFRARYKIEASRKINGLDDPLLG
jgi:nucleoside phosphorylase